MIIKEGVVLENIIELHQSIFGQEFPKDSYFKKIAQGKHLINHGLYVKDTLIGYCITIDKNEQKTLHPWTGGVLPQYQAQGFFSTYYHFIITQARNMNYNFVTGNTDNYKPNILKMFIKMGFDIVDVEKTPYGDGHKIKLQYKISQPVKLRISLTNSCNFDCFFCHHEGVGLEKVNALSIPQLERILIQAKKLHCIEISLTGGEPSLRLDAISYIVNYCNGWFCRPTIKIITNGSNWDDTAIHQISKYQGHISFNISLHSLDERCIEKITQKLIHRQMYGNLFDLLNKYNIPFKINTTILRGINNNDSTIVRLIDYALHCNASKISFMELLVAKSQTDLSPYYVSFSDLKSMVSEIIESSYQKLSIKETDKKCTFVIAAKNPEKILEVNIYRLSCRCGCGNCSTENDITIGADGYCYPCYLDANTNCGNAIQSLHQTVQARTAYITRKDNNFSHNVLLWDEDEN